MTCTVGLAAKASHTSQTGPTQLVIKVFVFLVALAECLTGDELLALTSKHKSSSPGKSHLPKSRFLFSPRSDTTVVPPFALVVGLVAGGGEGL